MKKSKLLFACAVIFSGISASCGKMESPDASGKGRSLTFTVSSADTKSNFKKGQVTWLAGDIIDIYDAAGTKASYTVKETDLADNAQSFSFTVEGLSDGPYNAVSYAASQSSASYDNATGTFSIDYGSGKAGKVDSFAFADCTVATSTGTDLVFKHTCGWICFTLKTNDPEATGKIRKVSLTLSSGFKGVINAKPVIDGDPVITVPSDAAKSLEFTFSSSNDIHERTIYVPVPAGTYKGLSITAAIGGTAYNSELESSNTFTVQRGVILNLGDISSRIKKTTDIKWVPVTDASALASVKSIIAWKDGTTGKIYAMNKTAITKNPTAVDISTIATVAVDGTLTGVNDLYVFQLAPSEKAGCYNFFYYTNSGNLVELGGSSTAQGISILSPNTNTTDWVLHNVEGKGLQMQPDGISTRFVYVYTEASFRLATSAQADGIIIYQKQ